MMTQDELDREMAAGRDSNRALLTLVKSAREATQHETGRPVVPRRPFVSVGTTAADASRRLAEFGRRAEPRITPEPEPDPPAWVDALPVPDVRRPPEDAPLVALVAHLVRLRWASLRARLRRWWPWGWVTVRDTGKTRYQVHPSGRRRVRQRPGGYQPIDRRWLESGEWSPPPSAIVPPPSPSAVAPASPFAATDAKAREQAERLAAIRTRQAKRKPPPTRPIPQSGRSRD